MEKDKKKPLMGPLSSKSLKTSFVFYVTSLIMIIMSLVAVTTITRERKALILSRVKRGEVLAEALHDPCLEALNSENYDALSAFASRFLRVEGLARITLLDLREKAVWNQNFKGFKDGGGPLEPVIYHEILKMKYYFHIGDYFHIENSIFDKDGNKLGAVRLRLGLLGVKEEIRAVMRDIILISLAAIIIGSLLSVILAGMIIGPLRQFSKATAEIARGNFEHSLDDSRDDELGDMAQAFNSMAGALKKTMESSKLANLGILAASVAHEIRNPLVTIRGLAEYMSKESALPAELKEDTVIMLREVDRLNGFVERLLDFAATKEKKQERCDLVVLLDEILPILHIQAKKQGIKLEKRVPKEAMIIGDGQDIKGLFFNIIFNGIQACGDSGRILLTITDIDSLKDIKEGHRFEQLEIKGEKMWRIDIIDDGQGIAPEVQSRIFEPFVTTKPGGTGLGLALAQRTVKNHGGNISLVSTPGLGTKVTVEIPALI